MRAIRMGARAHGGAEVHDCLGVVGDARARRVMFRELPQSVCDIPPVQRGANRMVAREHALDVAVEDGMALIEGKRQNRAGGRAADTGQAHDAFNVTWKFPAVVSDDLARGFVQVARAGVVAQAAPEVQHTVRPGARQRTHVGEAFGETFEVGDDGGHLGLLQHDLGNPDAVGVAHALPGKGLASVAVVPLEQPRAEGIAAHGAGSGGALASCSRRSASNSSS